MNNKKCQTAVEALITLGIMALLLTGIYLFYLDRQTSLYLSQKELEEKEECLQLTNAFTNVWVLSGEQVELNLKIKHQFTVNPEQQVLYSENSVCTIPLGNVAQNLSGQAGTFQINPGEVKVESVQGMVLVNND